MKQDELSSSAQRVQDTLLARGYANTVVEHPQTTRSAKEAAQVIGCSVAQIAKSLIFKTIEGGRPILVIACGVNRVNEARLGQQFPGGIERPDADYVQAATGFAIGGVPPVGHSTPLLTLIDTDLMQFDEIWAAAGTPYAVFRLTPQELVQMTGGKVVPVT